MIIIVPCKFYKKRKSSSQRRKNCVNGKYLEEFLDYLRSFIEKTKQKIVK